MILSIISMCAIYTDLLRMFMGSGPNFGTLIVYIQTLERFYGLFLQYFMFNSSACKI